MMIKQLELELVVSVLQVSKKLNKLLFLLILVTSLVFATLKLLKLNNIGYLTLNSHFDIIITYERCDLHEEKQL